MEGWEGKRGERKGKEGEGKAGDGREEWEGAKGRVSPF